MDIKISEVIKINSDSEIDELLKNKGLDFFEDEKTKTRSSLNNFWRPIGDNFQNASTIDLLSNGEKGIIERLTNAIDAVLEKEVKKLDSDKIWEIDDVLKNSFPNFYETIKGVEVGEKNRLNAVEAQDRVLLAINDGKTTFRPSFDIIDTGTGLAGEMFSKTILSLQGGNKIDTTKKYLIGSFGQGGSTSMAFSKSTIFISKINSEYFFSVVRKIELEDTKNHAYVYLNDGIPDSFSAIKLINDITDCDEEYLNIFLNSESGTLVKMIETDISKKYRDNDITKPNKLLDYINTELFNVKFPIKVIENRDQFKENVSKQNRNSFGSKLKLQTSKNRIDKYCGEITHIFKDKTFTVSYYVILPENEEDWAKDVKCKEKYVEYNCHEKPIIYTVNGQYINGASFTKLKNKGLNFLQYRLLVNVDLDKIGKEKYNLFTSDRSRIKETEKAKGLEDNIVELLSKQEPLISLNKMISEKSISSGIDDEMRKEIEDSVKEEYLDFLNKDTMPGGKPEGSNLGGEKEEIEYYDEIRHLEITNSKAEYYENEKISININTLARKDINKKTNFDFFINEKNATFSPTFLNGRMIYTIDNLEIGKYEIYIVTTDYKHESNKYSFEIIQGESLKKKQGKVNSSSLDINIQTVENKDYICEVSKHNEENKHKINVFVCFDHEELSYIFNGRKSYEIDEIKWKLLKPIAIFNLIYDSIQKDDSEIDVEIKNKVTEANIRSIFKNGFLNK